MGKPKKSRKQPRVVIPPKRVTIPTKKSKIIIPSRRTVVIPGKQ